MEGFFEVYEDGTVRAWVYKMGRCPKCKAEVLIAEPYRGEVSKVVVCDSCGYEQGFDDKGVPVVIGSLDCLDLQNGECLEADSLCCLVRCPYTGHIAC